LEGVEGWARESGVMVGVVGDAVASAGKLANAFRLYREALEKRPGLAEVHEALARIYEEKGHDDWAAVERQKARAIPALDCRSPSLECDFHAGRHQAVIAAAEPLRTAEGLYWLSRAANELAREAFA